MKDSIEVRIQLEDDVESKEKEIKQIYSKLDNRDMDIQYKDSQIV